MCKHLKQATNFMESNVGSTRSFVGPATHLCGDEGVDAVCVHAGDAINSVVPNMHRVAAVSHALYNCSHAI